LKDYERKTKGGGFVVGVPVCDWSTQTSWSELHNSKVMSWWDVSRETFEVDELARDRWQNYKGIWLDTQTFVGEADNIDTKNKRKKIKQRVSYCNVLSGRNAHDRREWLAQEKTTRIDAQLTIPTKLKDLRRIATYFDIVGSRWGVVHDGYSPATLALNKRSNEFYCRVYLKENDKGEMFIRYETELKGGKALQLANSIGEYGYYKAMSYGVNMLLLKLFYIPMSIRLEGDDKVIREWNENLEYVRFVVEGSGVNLAKIEKEQADIIGTWHWYMTCVLPAMERMATSKKLPVKMKGEFMDTLRNTHELCTVLDSGE
jgi:hypothetical protein